MISIIIPTFNEEESITRLISYIFSNSDSKEMELIISDGGSTDNTVELSKKLGAVVVESPKKGRASQMNFGASVAKGQILYFLHADSFPPTTFIKDIRESKNNGFYAGCYRLAFDDPHPLLSFYAWFTKFDIDYFRFGDQSLFIENGLFKKLGGFDEKLILMEDQMFVKKIKRKAKFEILDDDVITSARKYRYIGILKLQLVFSAILILFYVGVPQKKLVKFYNKVIR